MLEMLMTGGTVGVCRFAVNTEDLPVFASGDLGAEHDRNFIFLDIIDSYVSSLDNNSSSSVQ